MLKKKSFIKTLFSRANSQQRQTTTIEDKNYEK